MLRKFVKKSLRGMRIILKYEEKMQLAHCFNVNLKKSQIIHAKTSKNHIL